MTNPMFVPAGWAPQTAFTVSQTTFAAADIALTGIDGSAAQAFLTLPAGATLKAYRSPANWTGAGGVTLLTGGVWTPATTLGDWSLNVTPGAAATDTATLSLFSATSGAGGRLRLVATGLAGAAQFEPATNNLVFDRILAAPQVQNLQSNPPPPINEQSAVTLSAAITQSEVANPVPVLSLAIEPAILAQWATDPANKLAIPGVFPPGTSATFTAPAAYINTDLSFNLTAALDLGANGVIDPSDPVTTDKLTRTIQTVSYGMVLVLDRSGSMGASLGGGMSKWEASVRAAHAWSDLFRAFRPGGTHVAGVVTFENDTGSWTLSGPDDVAFRNPSTGAVQPAPLLKDLQNFGTIATWNLGTEQTSTPIGDGLVKAWAALSAQNPLPDRAAVVLMTDGYENSGAVTIATTQGAASAKFSVVRKDFGHKTADDLIGPRLYTLALGTTVDDDRLSALGSGYYLQIKNSVSELTGAFAAMLGHTLAAQEMPAGPPQAPDQDAPAAGTALYYPVPKREQVLAFLVQWNSATDRLRIGWRPQGSTGPFTLVANGGPVTETIRGTHGLTRIDLPAVVGADSPATEWRLQHVDNANPPNALPIGATDALVMVDLFTAADVGFDATEHYIGDAIGLVVKIASGGLPVQGAIVEYDVARPGESLGTYLTQHARGFLAQTGGKRFTGADPAKGKGLMVKTLFDQQKIENLGFVTVNGEPMLDDGNHGDGASNDGTYGAFYTDTVTEGTYTFRFRIEGTLSDGSIFTRIFTRSIWLGVRPEPQGLFPIWTTTVIDGGYQQSLLTIKPQTKTGQFLGPFRGDALGVKLVDADFLDPSGAFVDLHDGSYQLTITYKTGQVPVVLVTIYGQEMEPSGPVTLHPAGGGHGQVDDRGCRDDVQTSCFSLWRRAILCTWRKILRLFGL